MFRASLSPIFKEHKTTVTTASGNRYTVLLEPVWVCCGWRTPPKTHSNRFQLFHDSSRQQYGVMVTLWLVHLVGIYILYIYIYIFIYYILYIYILLFIYYYIFIFVYYYIRFIYYLYTTLCHVHLVGIYILDYYYDARTHEH